VEPVKAARGFVHHAKLISLLTLGSRILGVVRESLAARYFGAGLVSTAFTVAFTLPNLFRRLFGEGALSAAFIPLYSQSVKTGSAAEANRFAAAAVNLLLVILLTLTIIGEIVLFGLSRLTGRVDYLLTIRLAAIMLPYVLLVCGTAFLGAILQVHRKFGMTAAAPIILNVGLIGGTVAGAYFWDMSMEAGRIRGVYLVSVLVLVAGVFQVLSLVPALRSVGFRFDLTSSFRTPAIGRMLKLSVPVAVGAGVLQLSVVLDRSIAYFLAQGLDGDGSVITHFQFLGYWIAFPLEFGAAPRLWWAQNLYQFPLGVFAIALATAIFPALSADALDGDREKFREGLRRGIKVTLWEGLPASVGLIIVALPAVQLLFEGGRFTAHDSELVARSLRFYAMAIWAFSLQQIVSKAYYALQDTKTPLVLSAVTLVLTLAVEVPLLFTPLAEAGMACGTAVAFIVQALVMLWLLNRKVGGLGLSQLGGYVGMLLIATGVMTLACWLVQLLPFFPEEATRRTALARLLILMSTGIVSYFGACAAMGIGSLEYVMPRRKTSAA
jgi:putative peptidoglycan lipid II flippase